MFPLHKRDELSLRVSPYPNQQYEIPKDLMLRRALVDGNNISQNLRNSRGKSLCVMDGNKIAGENNTRKKMMHRDTERQRRQEMSTLYASLRSLLPLEFIKGKRSLSDQLGKAVKYIRYQEQKIKEIGLKRDELKNLPNLNGHGSLTGSSDQNISPCIVVHPSLVGVEIVYSCAYSEQGFPLSRVLGILVDEGLSVVSCVSTRVNERLLHTIQIEVDDPSSFNLCELQQKLIREKRVVFTLCGTPKLDACAKMIYNLYCVPKLADPPQGLVGEHNEGFIVLPTG